MTLLKAILTISHDELLQTTRALILQSAGYKVDEAIGEKEALNFINSGSDYNLILICHTVPESSKIAIAARAKELRPTLPILLLSRNYEITEAKVDGSLTSLESPVALLDMIELLTMAHA
jgi:DNA-binding response OmpR family regulator